MSILHAYSLRLIYNMGLQYYCLKDYKNALEMFKQSSALLYNHPILWLRMAECCMIVYRNNKETDNIKKPIKKYSNLGKDIPAFLILPGEVKHHHLHLNSDKNITSKKIITSPDESN